MHTITRLFVALGTILLAAGFAGAAAADGRFYDPRNAASPTGATLGHELFRTIGCPGRGLFDTPCRIEDSDGDGVPDDRDKCPDTPRGRTVDADGCEPASAAPAATAPAPATADLAPAASAEPAALAPAAATGPALVVEGVNFDFDKAVIRPQDRSKLDEDVAVLKQWGDVQVEVAGHADSTGPAEYNVGLSLRRAHAVRDYLVGNGIAADRLIVKGYGETRPVADNATAEGRFSNRRVELIPQR